MRTEPKMMYQVTPDEQSELLGMAAVLGLVQSGGIHGDTLVWTEGMDGWLEFDDVKGSFEWPEVAAEDEEEGLFYELEGGGSSDKLSTSKFLEVGTAFPRTLQRPYNTGSERACRAAGGVRGDQ